MMHRRSVIDPPPREAHRNAMNRNCVAHLSRTCGTCVHFDGPLRGAGECRKYRGPDTGSADARRCPDWTRKWAPGRVEGVT